MPTKLWATAYLIPKTAEAPTMSGSLELPELTRCGAVRTAAARPPMAQIGLLAGKTCGKRCIVARSVRILSAMSGLLGTMIDPVHDALKTAPDDDEPLTEEDRRALKTGREAIAKGDEIDDAKLEDELKD